MLTRHCLANSLQLAPLLSTCVDACQRGCVEIRNVHKSRDVSFQVELKDEQDPRSALTEADFAAQKAIVGALRQQWGSDLRIVGEEDGDEKLEQAIASTSFEPLKLDLFQDDIGETPEIDPSDITVYVDPLDGTREFVEERLDNCQVLVGIAVGGESVAGAVGIPFPSGNLDTDETVVYGLADVGTGVIGTPLKRGPFPLEKYANAENFPQPHYATGDSPAEVIRGAVDGIVDRYGGCNVSYGGAGNKILAAALGEVACSIQHKYGGPWDICAPEAILKAMGGRLTDLFGQDVNVFKADAPENCNQRGFIATGPGSDHEALSKALLNMPVITDYQKTVLTISSELQNTK
eukprot:scaffold22689_cov163-Cylindrotheca_fusiformis.AAC.5